MKATKRGTRLYLPDILDAIERIEKYTAVGKNEFFETMLVQDGVIRQLSVIGEASNRLPKSMQAAHKAIPWKKIIAMRNVIVHDYSEIDLQTIWDTVEKGLPILKKTVERMLREVTE